MKKFHRFISLTLCFVFLLSISLSCIPIRAQAYYDPASSTAYAAVGGIVVELFSEGAKLIASLLASGVKAAGKVITVDGLKKCSQVAALLSGDSFSTALFAFKAASFSPGSQFVADEDLVEELAPAVDQVFKGEVAVPSAGTQIYVPPDSIWSQAEYITYDRLVNSGFTDLDELNENVVAGNQISWQTLQKIMQLSGYLRTDFMDDLAANFLTLSSDFAYEIGILSSSISSDLSTLSSDISSYLEPIRLAVNMVTTTLAGKIDALKSALLLELGNIKTAISDFSSTTYYQLIEVNDELDELTPIRTGIDQLVGLFEEFTIPVPDVVLDLSPLTAAIAQMETSLSAKLVTLNTSIASLSTTFSTALTTLQTGLSAELATLRTTLSRDLATLNTSIGTLNNTIYDRVIQNLEQIKIYQINVRDTLHTELLKIASYEATINTNMKDYLQDVKDGLASLQKNTVYRLQTVETAIKNLPTTLTTLDDEILAKLEIVTDTTVALPDEYDPEDDDEKKPLFGAIFSGFSIGDDYFGASIENFEAEAAGLLVAAKIFNLYADVVFIKKLLIASASIGIVGALLGMALDVTGYSVSNYRRRESVAQSKASNRVKGGLVVQ